MRDLELHNLLQTFFAVSSFLSFGMELFPLCSCILKYTNLSLILQGFCAETALNLTRPLNCVETDEDYGALQEMDQKHF